ncbi:MAG: FtsW/RodA/SpoVE family cell cycle protein, partial [Micrococcales bacterium]
MSNLKDRAKGGFVGLFRGQSFEYRFLLAITFALFAIGVIMVLDASYVTQLSAGNNPFSTVLRQLGIGIGGIALMLFISRMSVERLIAIAPLYTISVLGLQGLTLLIGKAVGGNRNWIQIGTLPALQPSEFLKIGLIILVAKIAIERADDFGDLMHYWRWVAIYPGAGMVLVFLGGDMGTVMIMVAILLVQLMLIGLQRPYMRLLLLVVSLLALIGTFGSSNRRARTMAWLFPDSPDPMDLGWQSKHGVWALAAGGFGGVGFGNSTMKWSWIPEIDNDYIFAVLGEEFGMIGSAVVIGMFV